MAMEAGDCRKRTGLAWAIAEKIMAEQPEFDPHKNMAWLIPNAVAQAVVSHIQLHAEVSGSATSVTAGADSAPITGNIA